MSAAAPKAGDTLAGKYRLERVLGEGGMGTVFQAEHLRLKQPVAVKVMNPDMLGVEDVLKRFDREARAAATLKSRHVVRVSDVETEGTPYMVMELLHGVDLESVRGQRSKLPYEEVVDYVLQACDALAEAHEAGIVHRDLKPANLFLATQDDESVLVKVLDFGVSKILTEETKLTAAGAMVGTTLYMSPEQLQGEAIDARSDIWALGVMIYELIAGDAPWTGPAARVAAAIVVAPTPDIRERVTIPEPLAVAIERMLQKKAADRPASIAEVAALLAPFAPARSAGAEAAERIAKRANRSSSPRVSGVASSSSEPVISSARTILAERSTDIGATLPNQPRKGGLRGGIVIGIAAGAVVAIAAGAFALRSRGPAEIAAVPAPRAPEPGVSVAAAPPVPPPPSAAPSAVASAAPSLSAPKTKPGARPSAPVKTAEAAPAQSAPPRPPPPRPPPPPAATNPTFLN